MKTFRYVAIFLLLFFTFVVIHGYNVDVYGKMVNQKAEYNHALDSALDSAVEGIVEDADGNTITINFEQCVNNFYRDLYASFGAIDSTTMQQKLDLYTPVLAVADRDGVYVYYSDIVGDKIVRTWSQKMPYLYSGVTEHYSYNVNFTMGEEVVITIDGINSVYSGRWGELSTKYPDSAEYAALREVLRNEVLSTSGAFQAWKNDTITRTIVEKLNYYVNRHNRIANAFGEQFTFQLPVTAESDISRGIENVSFMCFFQGYPFGAGTSTVYSKFEISGARVVKNGGFYTRLVDGYLYYHRASCKKGEGLREWYATQEECALKGALPC